jgi:hypothetical protein
MAEMEPAAPVAGNERWKVSEWDRKVLPVLVSAAVLGFYLREVEWQKLAEASRRANLTVAFAAVVAPQVFSWFMGALMVERTLHWFHGPFPLKAYFWVRGASYILAFVNNALHGGGLFLYQKFRADISWIKLLGVLLFRLGLFLWSVGLVMIPATAALHQYGLAEKAFGSQTMIRVWWAILIFPGVLFLLGNWLYWFRGIDFTGLGRLIVRNRSHEFWTAFRCSRPRHWLLLWAIALPQLFLAVLCAQLLNLAFGIRAPWVEAAVVLPFAFVVMDLPIAFSGFGTMTLAWMTFFGDYGSLESITALTLFVPVARILCRAAIGAVSLKPALSEINALLRPAGKEEKESLPSSR